MKQEKLCEIEDMNPKDYNQWYANPMDEKKFKEELGAANSLYIAPEDLAKMRDQFGPQYSKPRQKLEANSHQIGGDHYKKMDIQPWDVIDHGPKQQAIGFYRYNALKYIMRAGEKGEFKEDIAKAQHYLEKLLEIL